MNWKRIAEICGMNENTVRFVCNEFFYYLRYEVINKPMNITSLLINKFGKFYVKEFKVNFYVERGFKDFEPIKERLNEKRKKDSK